MYNLASEDKVGVGETIVIIGDMNASVNFIILFISLLLSHNYALAQNPRAFWSTKCRLSPAAANTLPLNSSAALSLANRRSDFITRVIRK